MLFSREDFFLSLHFVIGSSTTLKMRLVKGNLIHRPILTRESNGLFYGRLQGEKADDCRAERSLNRFFFHVFNANLFARGIFLWRVCLCCDSPPGMLLWSRWSTHGEEDWVFSLITTWRFVFFHRYVYYSPFFQSAIVSFQ